MTSVLFGQVTRALDDDLIGRLEDHHSLFRQTFPNQWSAIPEADQRKLARAVNLAVSDFDSAGKKTTFLAEWDTVESYSFRDTEFWIARTSRVHVTLKEHASPWLVFLEGGGASWVVAGRISKVLFDTPRGIHQFEFPSDLLKTLLIEDSRGERYMWWRGVEGEVDGALRGPNLPRGKGLRDRFDKAGHPYFAKFESKTLNKQVAISCKKGSISGANLTATEAIGYFEKKVLPGLTISSTR